MTCLLACLDTCLLTYLLILVRLVACVEGRRWGEQAGKHAGKHKVNIGIITLGSLPFVFAPGGRASGSDAAGTAGLVKHIVFLNKFNL